MKIVSRDLNGPHPGLVVRARARLVAQSQFKRITSNPHFLYLKHPPSSTLTKVAPTLEGKAKLIPGHLV